MSVFPVEFNPRDDVLAYLDLCQVDTPDGPMRFILGTEGRFVDVHGNVWVGSQLLNVTSLAGAFDGAAPEGSITLSFFQDPDAPKLVQDVRELGLDYIAGRTVTFFAQPICAMDEFSAPKHVPIRWMQRTMRRLSFGANAAQDRSITVHFEAWTENRRAARRLVLNDTGHSRMLGHDNPSLEHMPTDDHEEERLFG